MIRTCCFAVSMSLILGSAVQAAEIQVQITDYAIVPQTVTIAPGDSVVWTNHDQSPHNISASDKKFHSPPLDTDDQYSRVFHEPGTVAYFCVLHPHMVGTIIVKP